jgi:hypothetical protein
MGYIGWVVILIPESGFVDILGSAIGSAEQMLSGKGNFCALKPPVETVIQDLV